MTDVFKLRDYIKDYVGETKRRILERVRDLIDTKVDPLQRELGGVDRELIALREHAVDLKGQYESVGEHIRDLNNRLEEHRLYVNELSEVEIDTSDFVKEPALVEIVKKLNAYEETFSRHRETVQGIMQVDSEQRDAIRVLINKTREEVRGHTDDLALLTDGLDGLSTKIDALSVSDRVDDIEKNLVAVVETIKDQGRDLEAEFEQVRNAIAERILTVTVASEIADVNKALRVKDAITTDLSSRLDDLHEDIDSVRAEAKKRTLDRVTRDASVDEWRDSLTVVLSQQQRTNDDLANRIANAEALVKQQAEHTSKEQKRLESLFVALEEANERKNAQIEELTARLQTAEETTVSLRESFELFVSTQAADTRKELEQQFESTKQMVRDAVGATLTRIEQLGELVDKEKQDNGTYIRELSDAIAELRTAVEAVNKKAVDNAESIIKNTSLTLAADADRVKDIAALETTLEDTRATLDSRFEALKKDLTDVGADINGLEKQTKDVGAILSSAFTNIRAWHKDDPEYSPGQLATHRGGLWAPRKATTREPYASDDWLLVSDGVHDVQHTESDEGMHISVMYASGQTRVFTVPRHKLQNRGTWKKGEYYVGDSVLHDGHRWEATRSTSEEPGSGKDWLLIGMRGGRGRKGADAPAIDPGTIIDAVLEHLDARSALEEEKPVRTWRYGIPVKKGDFVAIGGKEYVALRDDELGKENPTEPGQKTWRPRS